MPIRIVNNTFTDIFSNDLGFYQSNAGDKVTLVVDLEANIRVTENATTTIQMNWTDQEFLLLSAQSFLTEGFRVGDSVTWELLLKSDGTTFRTTNTTINYVDDSLMRVDDSFGAAFDNTLYYKRILTSRVHDDLVVKFNHTLNDSPASYNSLIDNETTSIKFSTIDGMSVAGTVNGALVGNQSGQYLISGVIERMADAFSSRVYELTLVFVNSGVLNSEWFEFGDCLKLALDYKFYSLAGETANIPTLSWTETANTGFFGEAFNTSVVDSTLTTGITSIDYAVATTADIVFDTSETEFYIGAQYISTNTDRYKNKVENQNTLGLLLNDYTALTTGTKTSIGGLYEIEINSINTVSTVTTVNITFTPLAGFETLMDSFDLGDRLFYIWIKAGNVNHLAFNSQLTKSVNTELPLIMKTHSLNRHDNNTTVGTDSNLVQSTDTEDDLFFYGSMQYTKSIAYTGVRFQILVKNSLTLEEFTLEEMLFDLSVTPRDADGYYLINDSQAVANNLQTTNTKKSANLYNDSSSNLLFLYYPFVNKWQYWLTQANAANHFYPNKNKDWVDYIGGDWTIECRTRLEGEVNYSKDLTLTIKDYNSEPLITSVITYYRADGSLTTSLWKDEIMTVKATHTYTGYTAVSSWGEITIESYEGSPRWNSSTVVAFDGNINNPLQPISGGVLTKTATTNETILSCKVDTSKLDTLQHKFTSKIFLEVVDGVGLIFQNEVAVQAQDEDFLNTQNEV
jgi:hypothetical protein